MKNAAHLLPGRAAGFVRGMLLGLFGLIALGACSSSTQQPGVLLRTDTLDTVLDAGMAVAPVLVADPVVLYVDHSSLMTDELYAGLFAYAGEAPLVAPSEVRAIVENGGPAHIERYQQFRRDLAMGELPSKDRAVQLSRVVQHRFFFVSWYRESKSGGVETGSGDYREEGFATEVGRTEFSEVVGQLEAVVIDLWEGTVVWRALEDYRTARLYGAPEEIEAELERTRVGAAARLAGRFEPS